MTTTAEPTAVPVTTRKDWSSDQEVRWCPGCGDYSILAAVQMLMPALGVRRENTVFLSGIGCAARFPYYMNTYGMHSIHGRAPAIATGLATSRPDLDVWVISGDGDSLSIGGNHLIHALRRNVRLNILMFNNQIYGLTKGQYSPTSEVGKVTKSTPFGSYDTPFNPVSFGAGGRGHLRGPHPRHGPGPHARDVPAGARAQWHGLRRGPAELQRLQRRGLREDHRQRGALQHAHPAGARPADRVRRRGRASAAWPSGPTAASRSSRWARPVRPGCWCTTRSATTRVWPSRCPAWPVAPTSRRRSVSSGPSSAPSTASRCPSRSCRPRRSAGLGDIGDLLRSGSSWTVE